MFTGQRGCEGEKKQKSAEEAGFSFSQSWKEPRSVIRACVLFTVCSPTTFPGMEDADARHTRGRTHARLSDSEEWDQSGVLRLQMQRLHMTAGHLGPLPAFL